MDIETLRKEVTQGNMQALFSLAQKYWQGEGVKKSKKKALELWNEGALKGDGACAFHLGTLYEKGLIVKKDYNQARYYYLIAYRNHHFSLHSSTSRYNSFAFSISLYNPNPCS